MKFPNASAATVEPPATATHRSLCRRPSPTTARSETNSKLGHHAYRYLKQRLLDGELAEGDRISEVQLAASLGMSRTPVREAIRRLEVEGVLETLPSNGTFVKRAERMTILEVYELRIAIESFAVQKAVRRMKPDRIRQLQDHCDRMLEAIRDFRDSGTPYMEGEPFRRYLESDIRFHLLLLEEAENRHALTIYSDLNLRSAIFGCHSHDRDLHHVAKAWRQHARVVRAARQRNGTAARRALEKHMRESMESALEAYDARAAGRSTPLPQEIADYTETMAALLAGPRKQNGSRTTG